MQRFILLQVLRGGDRAIDVVVIDPDIKVTEHEVAKTEGYITHKATKEGKLILYYICTTKGGPICYIYMYGI